MLGLFKRKTFPYTAGLCDRPVGECCFAVVDTELTGLDPRRDSIVSVGGIRMTGRRIRLGEVFYRVVKPQTALTSESVVIHGITPSEVEGEPSIDRVLADFTDFCRGAIVVGHFISLDLKFLNKELKRLFGKELENPAVDTNSLYDWIKDHNGGPNGYPGDGENRDLFSLAQKYRIRVTGAHNALMDAYITAQLFQRFLSRLPTLGISTAGDLLRIGRP
ncbi:MAG: 3'-5' exonuclease [Nitrospirota bacterium]